MNDPRTGKTHLTSWKDVAAFFGTTERTVMRWEAERGLPIHRLPGKARSRIYAEVAELRGWMALPAASTAPAAPAAPRRFGARIGIAAALLALIAAGGAAAFWSPAPRQISDAARGHFLIATRNWQARTPQGLNRAIDEFGRALAIDPDYAQAWAGLATTWNLMPEYTITPPQLAFARAAAAARAALARDDGLASAHAALAFASFYGNWDAATARREFQRALERDPDNADIEHWYATFLMTVGAFRDARAHIDRALALNPDSRAIRADRAIILVHLDLPEAIRELQAQTARDPDYRSPHAYLGWAYRIAGDDRRFLDETEIGSRLQGDQAALLMVQAARAALLRGGHDAMQRAILAVRRDQFARGATSASDLVQSYGAVGDASGAADILRRAIDRHDPSAIYVVTDPLIGPSVRADPAYRAQVARLGFSE